jgi:putative ABC transport system permease protein
LEVRAARALYGAVLGVCFPGEFRRAHGREMVRAFEALAEAARRRGAWRLVLLVVRGLRDLVVEGTAERSANRRKARSGDGSWLLRVGELRQDLRLAMRAIRRRPLFAAAVVGTVAIGVGANTAIFSVVNGVLLRPYGWRDGNRVVVIWDARPGEGRDRIRTTGPTYRDWKDRATSFSAMSATMAASWTLGGDGADPVRVDGVQADADYFRVLGVEARLGRVFRPEEIEAGADVAILSDALWRTRYGSDPGVVGRTVDLDDRPYEIVGVMPPAPFPVPSGILSVPPPAGARLVWTPYRAASPWLQRRNSHIVTVIARIRPGLSLERAQQEMSAIAAGLADEHPAEAGGFTARVLTVREQVVGDVRADLLVVFGTVALVLLLACANLTNLLLSRVVERRREFSLRLALGAGRARLIRQMSTEIACLGLLGGAAGLAIAWRGMAVLPRLLPAGLPRQDSIAIDPAVLLFTLAATLGTSALIALGPAARASSGAGGERRPLRSGGRGGTTPRRELRLHRGLVISQLAIATMLLAGAGLLLRSFAALRSVDPGFDPVGLATAGVIVPAADREDPASITAWLDGLLDDVRHVPGVDDAALAYDPPFASSWWEGFELADRPVPPDESGPNARFRIAGDAYFETAGVEIVQGRSFSTADRADAPGALIVNEAFVRRFLPGRDPIGVRINHSGASRRYGPEAGFPTTFTIVGVARDVRFMGPREGSAPAFYMPMAQYPVSDATLLVRHAAGTDSHALDVAIAAVFRTHDPSSPPPQLVPTGSGLAQLLAQDRFNTRLVAAFALLALVLAAAGIHAVLAYAVARRRTELGIRTALGASPARLRAAVLGEMLRMGALGLAAGLAGALALGRFLSGLLFAVPASDPPTLLGVAATLALVALVSAWLPAHQAATSDPSHTLRE